MRVLLPICFFALLSLKFGEAEQGLSHVQPSLLNLITGDDSAENACPSRIIQRDDLRDYVNTMLQDKDAFKKQYKSVRNGELRPAEVAKRPENLHKNRYPDDGLFPYDETRVVLEPLPGDEHSDFINANYITGYNKSKEFIATQGPLKHTLFDFWRMIWQERACKILMFANVYEHGKVKVEKYWPDVGESVTHGDITIRNIHEEVFVDYTIRDFVVTREGHPDQLEVRHFHFTAWPDMGVPSYALSLVKLLKMAKVYKPECTAPDVHHCSAGIGRTGTVTLIRILMDTIDGDGKVDVLKALCQLRYERMESVETPDQFAFIHKSLVQYLHGEDTSIPATEFSNYYQNVTRVNPALGYSKVEKQYMTFLSLKKPISLEDAQVANRVENAKRNRMSSIVPPDDERPVIHNVNGSDVYINAVYVNGYKESRGFINTQYPLPNTVQDFWTLVYESGADTTVVLNDIPENDESCSLFWPVNGHETYGDIRLEHLSSEEKRAGGIVVHEFSIDRAGEANFQTNRPQQIKLIQLKGWKAHETVPNAVTLLLFEFTVAEALQSTQRRPIIVACYDGAKACGLFSASAYLASQVRHDREIDVLMSARNAAKYRPASIENVYQYRVLYEFALSLVVARQ